jgi:hypothetical protein
MQGGDGTVGGTHATPLLTNPSTIARFHHLWLCPRTAPVVIIGVQSTGKLAVYTGTAMLSGYMRIARSAPSTTIRAARQRQEAVLPSCILFGN